MSKPGFTFGVLVSTFWLFLAMSIQAQRVQTQAGTSTISGRITLKGEPARKVLVYLQPPITSLPTNPDAYLRSRTGDDGQYHIAGVAAGSYSVCAVAPGFIFFNNQSGQENRTLNVSEGEKIENIDFELKQGAVITGRVADSRGRPLADERVTLSKLDKNNQPRPANFYGRNFTMFMTDDRGVYRLYGVPEGRYLISVGIAQSAGMIARRGGGAFYPRAYYPDAANESEAKVIELSEGSEMANVDIIVPESKQSRAVSGRVVNAETGRPVAGVEIAVSQRSDDGRYYGWWAGMGSVRSSANGEFQLKGIIPGKYGVFPRGGGDNEFVGEPAPCDLSEGDASGVEIKVRRGGSISGFVLIEGASDPAPLQKLPQLSLRVIVRPDQPTPSIMDNPKVNADGSFYIRGLSPCSVDIQYYGRPETGGLTLTRIELNGAPVRGSIKVGAGEQVTGARVVLTYRTFALRGEVKFSGGALPASQRLYANVRRTDQQPSFSSGAEVDPRGQFVIDGLTPGEYEVTVGHVPYWGADPIDPRIAKALLSARDKVTINNVDQRVTFVVDLGRKEEEK
ncbi:MAG: carboxypeptidase regulatory-like domain-containing protein [Chloracidobacterium sp.]|nr:carboxypeptidase regulatory-like domain-containing protein [Chloracidobacterium sp.]